jgi:hypothetical protein
LHCRCIRTRRVSSSSAAWRPPTGRGAATANRKPSISWASPSSVGKSLTGKFLIHRKSRRDRVQAKLLEIKEALRRRMHQSIPEQGKWLRQVVRGFFNYHAVPTNSCALAAFRYHVADLWRRTLRQRSQKDNTTWARMTRLANDWLPKPTILHPWPSARFTVKHPRWEPDARIGPVRICAGGAQQCRDATSVDIVATAKVLRDEKLCEGSGQRSEPNR